MSSHPQRENGTREQKGRDRCIDLMQRWIGDNAQDLGHERDSENHIRESKDGIERDGLRPKLGGRRHAPTEEM